MKKMRLDLDGLSVESFDTLAATRDPRGTVRGHDSWQEPQSIDVTCECPPPATNFTACGQVSCYQTCDVWCSNVTCSGSTCLQTCPNSCNWCTPEG